MNLVTVILVAVAVVAALGALVVVIRAERV